MRDLASNITVKPAIFPVAARTDNTAVVSTILDTFGFGSSMLALIIGVNTDTNATFAALLEESNDSGMAGANAVVDGDMIGTEALASFTAADDDSKTRKLGYIGNKRYIRATVTPSGNDSGNIFLAGVWLQGHPRGAPTANPPQ